MMGYGRRTIKYKLFMLSFVTSSIAVLLACLAFVAFTAFDARKMLEEDVTLLSRVLSEKLALTLMYDRPQTAAETLASLREKPSILKACVFDQQNRLFSHYAIQGTCPDAPSPLGEHYMGRGGIYGSHSITLNGEALGSIYIESDTRRMMEIVKQTLINTALVFFITLLLGLWMSRKMQHSIATPLTELIDISKQVKAGNYSVRATHITEDEIGKLVKSFNRMVGTIEATTGELEQANSALHLAIERANRMSEFRTRWTHNISHEMRTPIHAILSYLEFAQDTLKEHSSPDKKLEECLEKADLSAKRLNILITDLLDFNRFETDNARVDTEQHQLNHIVEHCIQKVKSCLEAKQITLLFDKKPDDSAVFLNLDRVKQVILHLLDNAINYSPARSTISLSVKKTFLTDNGGRKIKALQLSIQDEGCGIPENELETVFEPFTESSRTAKKSGGKGLGLALCKEIVYAHNGKIWAENNPNAKGLSAHVIIPTHV